MLSWRRDAKERTNVLTFFATEYTAMQLRSEEIRKVGR